MIDPWQMSDEMRVEALSAGLKHLGMEFLAIDDDEARQPGNAGHEIEVGDVICLTATYLITHIEFTRSRLVPLKKDVTAYGVNIGNRSRRRWRGNDLYYWLDRATIVGFARKIGSNQ